MSKQKIQMLGGWTCGGNGVDEILVQIKISQRLQTLQAMFTYTKNYYTVCKQY